MLGWLAAYKYVPPTPQVVMAFGNKTKKLLQLLVSSSLDESKNSTTIKSKNSATNMLPNSTSAHYFVPTAKTFNERFRRAPPLSWHASLEVLRWSPTFSEIVRLGDIGLAHAGMTDCKLCSSPVDIHPKLSATAGSPVEDPTNF